MEKSRHYYLVEALSLLRPDSKWALKGETYDAIEWYDEEETKPTREEVNLEATRLENLWRNTEYQRRRAAEYPPVTDYLDAVVKGDQAQIQAYIDACLAVKAKYPKPEGV